MLFACVCVCAVMLAVLSGCKPKGKIVEFDDKKAIEACFQGSNQCTATYEKINGTKCVKLQVSDFPYEDTANDPFTNLFFKEYCKMTKNDPILYEEYPYLVLKLKVDHVANPEFELFFNVEPATGADFLLRAAQYYDNEEKGFQYVLFDLSGRDVKGAYSFFRFDFVISATSKDAVYISEMIFEKTFEDALRRCGGRIEDFKAPEMSTTVLSDKSSSAPSEYLNYKAKTASDENANLDMWFNHMYTKTPKESNTKNGTDTYCIYLAQNEIEGCQLVLGAKEDFTGLSLEVGDFTGEGGTVTTEVLEGYYFSVEGENVIDPLPPLSEKFDIPKGESKSFVIKAKTLSDPKPGVYKSTVNVKDSSGKIIKTADIFCVVWNFRLPDVTSLKTLADLSWWAIYVNHECYEGDDSELFCRYYDLMLENRFNAYDIPFNTEGDKKGTYADPRVIQYLDNPRVTAFQALGWKTKLTAENIQNAYSFLSQKQEWLDKAYFYPIDEPIDELDLYAVKRNGKLIKENFPGYKLIVPMHYNKSLNDDSTMDYFKFLEEYVTAWCPHNFFFNSWAEHKNDPRLYVRTSASLEKNLGTFKDRMAKEQAGGDEVWWYVTRIPNSPEITLTIETQSLRHREFFWQAKQYNIDGFLYYLVNDWAPKEANFGVDPKHEEVQSQYNVYGNGVLLYCGKPFDVYGPVTSLRFENVRDGIEDYEYLTMLEKLVGEEEADKVVNLITKSLSVYNTDEEYFTAVRLALGNYLSAKA